MDFEFTKEQLMFRDMARDFAQREINLDIMRECDRTEKFYHALHKKLGEAGLLGMLLPTEYGGLGLDYITATLVTEELSKKHYQIGAAIPGMALPGLPIVRGGTEEQKQKYLPSLIKGEKILCVAVNEANTGSDASAIETMAVLDKDEWVINGTKTFIAHAGVADVIELVAQTDKSKGFAGQAMFIFDKKIPGIYLDEIKHIIGQRTADHCSIRFANCRIPKDSLLGEVGKGLRLGMVGISAMRWGIAAASIGMAQDCLDRCIEYAKTRHQFGKPIGSFQLVQGILAEMEIDIQAARHFTYHLAWLKDKGLPHHKETSIAKLYASEMAIRVTQAALHLHGAYATTDDLPIEERYRTAPLPTIYGGTSEIHRLLIGQALTGINAIGGAS